ncbi:ABC transporter substrate-binding protein [Halomonas sp. M5N1S17]|uniref:ABC transporter substrate-binding protein n=1 Tax=Halomonas alkalisoli TaxID=2907158 RepID=UPI001F316046|nr:ABC transporter substrate-binding protein [Halomonas alkalisoli]MCE9662824.1 ABC transporter substrate-binding protein [Halomonas alkalisoli]
MNDRTKYPFEGSVSRRSFLAGMTGAAAAAVMPMGAMLNPRYSKASGHTVMNMQLGWIVTNGQLGEVVASELGYYAEENLSLEITAGGPNVDGIANVYAERAQLGQVSSSPSIMMARAAGLPIKCIAAGYQEHPFTYFSLKDNPVNEPKDLIGKKVGTNGTARILLQALLAQHDIPESEVEVLVIGSNMAPLITGQVDVVTGWQTNASALRTLGDERVDMRLWDAGVRLYANPYYATDDAIENDHDQLEGFIRATARGWGWAYENREKAVEILVNRYPNLNLENELRAVDAIMDYVFTGTSKANGWGSMEKTKWQDQIDTYAALGQFEGSVPTVEDIMTDSVLKATSSSRPKFG